MVHDRANEQLGRMNEMLTTQVLLSPTRRHTHTKNGDTTQTFHQSRYEDEQLASDPLHRRRSCNKPHTQRQTQRKQSANLPSCKPAPAILYSQTNTHTPTRPAAALLTVLLLLHLSHCKQFTLHQPMCLIATSKAHFDLLLQKRLQSTQSTAPPAQAVGVTPQSCTHTPLTTDTKRTPQSKLTARFKGSTARSCHLFPCASDTTHTDHIHSYIACNRSRLSALPPAPIYKNCIQSAHTRSLVSLQHMATIVCDLPALVSTLP